MKRIGEMIRFKPEGKEAYIQWHANPMPGVNEMIKACNIQNYSIYSRGDYLFAYYEYVGDDFEADMAKMAADPNTQKWWDVVKPLMEPLEDRVEGEFWSGMKEVYDLDGWKNGGPRFRHPKILPKQANVFLVEPPNFVGSPTEILTFSGECL